MSPPDLEGPDTSNAGQWYAVHTRSNHERKVAQDLTRKGFEAYLPEYQTWSRRRDRRKRISRPLFPGYLFVRTQLDSVRRLGILQAPSVVRILGNKDRPVAVPDDEVESIQLLLGAIPDADPRGTLVQGSKVQVMDGPLKGVVGRVESTPAGNRIVVSVDLLGRAVSATLQTEAIVPYLE